LPKLSSTAGRRDAAGFAATRWTLVLAAGGEDAPRAAEAMAELCRIYWYPLYAYIRHRGHPSHESEDLTQEFFVLLLGSEKGTGSEKETGTFSPKGPQGAPQKRCLSPFPSLAGVDRRNGKFRSFLLAALKHFLANQWDRTQAQKRGGGQAVLSLDALSAEGRYRREPAHNLTPERLFERQWALTVLERVLARLQSEHEAGGKAALFQTLKPFLTSGRPAATYAEAAAALQMSAGAVKVAIHRLRRRYRQLLKEEIAHTVAKPEEIDDEIRYLMACL
jgi:DNA-directed RNA polymerase specialized sigma24 family protein